MGVTNSFAGRPILLLLERERQLIPLNPIGLTVAQSSQSKLRKAYVGAALLSLDGSIRTVRDVRVQGLYGSTFGRKLLSALTGVWSINVILEQEAKLSLADIKGLVTKFIGYDAASPDPLLPQSKPTLQIIDSINQARSVEEVFAAFEVPSLEDCLDVL